MLGKFPMDKISKDPVGGYMSILESEAGIMPRTIHHIFQGLQRQVSLWKHENIAQSISRFLFSINFSLDQVYRLFSENNLLGII